MFLQLHAIIKRVVGVHHKWMMLHRRPEWEQLPRGFAKPAGDFAVCTCGVEVRVPRGTTHYDAWSRHFSAVISVTVNDYIRAEEKFIELEAKLTAMLEPKTERTGAEIVVSRRPNRVLLPGGVAQDRSVRELRRSEPLALGGAVSTSTKPLSEGFTDLWRPDSLSPFEVISLEPEVILNARTSFTSLLEEAHGVALEELELIGGGRE